MAVPRIRPELSEEDKRKMPQPLPYVKGLTERLTKAFRKAEARVYYKPFNTLRSQLVHPKDKTPKEKKCGVVYEISCGDCNKKYIGETARPLNTRVKEHTSIKRASLTAVGEHCKSTGHSIPWDNISVIARENNNTRRKIREALEIEISKPHLNRDQGYELPPVYKKILRKVRSRDSTEEHALRERSSIHSTS